MRECDLSTWRAGLKPGGLSSCWASLVKTLNSLGTSGHNPTCLQRGVEYFFFNMASGPSFFLNVDTSAKEAHKRICHFSVLAELLAPVVTIRRVRPEHNRGIGPVALHPLCLLKCWHLPFQHNRYCYHTIKIELVALSPLTAQYKWCAFGVAAQLAKLENLPVHSLRGTPTISSSLGQTSLLCLLTPGP